MTDASSTQGDRIRGAPQADGSYDASPTRGERFDLRAIYETSRLLSTSLDLEFVLNSLLLTVMSKLLTTRGVIAMHDPIEGAYRVSVVRNVKAFEEGSMLDLSGVRWDDVLVDGHVPRVLAEQGLRVAVPLRFGEREIGMLAVGGKATGELYTAFELEFIRSLADMSSTAVHNSLMVRELQVANRDLDARIQELNTLFDLSREFNASIDREHLVKLLSFALMGQMLVSSHLFLLRRRRRADAPPEVFVAASMGLPDRTDPLWAKQLCELDELVILNDDPKAFPHGSSVPSASNGPIDEVRRGLRDRGLMLALPLKHQGETRGALCLGSKRTGRSYTPGDIEFLSSLGHLALVSIQHSFLVEEQIEKERLEEEMRLARRIQERLLPQRTPAVNGYEIAALAQPSRFVGGDYYDVVELQGGRLLAAIADVTGKGVPAALLMANLQASLHVMLPMDLSIEQAAGHVNRVICENTDADKFITFFVAILHVDSGTMDYVNAGHNPPMLVRRNGSIELLETGGLLLGVLEQFGYERGRVKLAPDDVVALFTDGVTEAMDGGGREYHEDRLQATLKRARSQPASIILKAVREDVAAFMGSITDLSDDLTLVVIKRTGRGG